MTSPRWEFKILLRSVEAAEVWAAVAVAAGAYEVSNLGGVRSLDRSLPRRDRWGGLGSWHVRGRVLKPWADAGGYPTVYVCFDGARTAVNVHRLVAEAFCPKPADRDDVNHKDGVKANCRAGNLEWCTKSENMVHARDAGLTHDTRRPLLATPKGGGAPLQFPSSYEAARRLGLKRGAGNIRSAVLGQIPSAYGFTWRYAPAAIAA